MTMNMRADTSTRHLNMAARIRVSGLAKRYGALEVFRGIEFKVNERCIDGLIDVDAGEIIINEERVASPILERLSHDEQRAVLIDQGLTEDQATSFIAEAEARGLSDFLENPQNLLLSPRYRRHSAHEKTSGQVVAAI
jgi:hypothetical protein